MKKLLTGLLSMVTVLSLSYGSLATAQTVPSDDFSLEVSPSPLSTTVEPGKVATLELKIRNASTKTEQLKIESRSFTLSTSSTQVTLSETAPKEMTEWVTYSQPTFSVEAGAWFTQRITLNLPQSAGFTYPFAVVIGRANEKPTDASSGRLLKGSVAVFALVNIDKPGATRKLELASFTTSQAVYEYLPATLKLTLKNTGNSIVQPYGNFYVQSGNNPTPLSVLPVNETQGYILPGTSREITADWRDGFPVYRTENNEEILDWSPSSGGKFRFGLYTAKVVAVYNDGTRDIPIVGEVTFWVVPWKILLVLLAIFGLVAVGLWAVVRRLYHKLKKRQPPVTR